MTREKLLTEPTNAQRARALPWALAGVISTAVFVNLGSGGPIFMLFLDKLGLSKSQIGIIMSIVPFLAVLTLVASGIAAKVGFKRIFLRGWTARVLVLGLLAFAPFIVLEYGVNAAFYFTLGVFAVFAICRMVAVAGMEPWMQVAIPPKVRGKFTAASNVGGSFASAVTIALAGIFLGTDPSIERFSAIYVMVLITGLAGVLFYLRVPPSGSSAKGREKVGTSAILKVLRDKKFMLFMLGGGLVTMAIAILNPGGFLALYLKDTMGFNTAQVSRVGAVYMAVGIFTSMFWGWAADRYGSKPILMISLLFIAAYPIALALIPREWARAFAGVMFATIIFGLIMPAWIIAYSRYLVVNMIPAGKRGSYSALQLSITGIFGGLAPIFVGFVLEQTAKLSGGIGPFVIGPYTPLFLVAFFVMGGAIILFSWIPSDSRVSTAQFAGMLVEGNPLAAMQAMYSFSQGGAEEKRMLAIDRLARARSPLAVDELLEAFADPSPYVRTQAVIAAASSKPHPHLIDALTEMAKLERLETSMAAAWALGKLGAQQAIEPMRQLLNSKHALLRGRAAVVLSRLGDQDSAPQFLKLLMDDDEAEMAYADALGVLRYEPGIIPILDKIAGESDAMVRQSMAFAVATIVGRENMFLLLSRRMNKDLQDAQEEVHQRLCSVLAKISKDPERVAVMLDEALMSAREGNRKLTGQKLTEIISLLPRDALSDRAWIVLDYALSRMSNGDVDCIEYGQLVVHSLLSQLKQRSFFRRR